MANLLSRLTKPNSIDESSFRKIFLGILIAAGLLSFANTFHADFTFDGRPGILENRAIRNLENISEFCGGPKLSRCLTYLSFALNYQVHGYRVQGYHTLNLAFHIGNAWLVFLLIQAFFKICAADSSGAAASRMPAAFAALLFLVHPVQTQAVTYVWQRGTLLAALFYLLSVYYYLTGRIRNSRPRILGALLCILLGSLSKEIIYTVPLTLLIVETGFLSAKRRASGLLVWIWVSLLASLLIIPLKFAANLEMKFYFTPHFYHGRLSAVGWDYFLTQINVVRTYLRLLLVPYPLNLDYYYPISTSFFEWKTILSFLLEASLVTVGIVLFLRKGAAKIAGFGILWFFITLSVESTVIPLRDVIFEHRLYLPSVGFASAAACAVWLLSKKLKNIGVFCALLLLCLFSAMTFQRNFVWQSDFTLWADAARKSPESPRPPQFLGAAHVREAEKLRSLGRHGEAVQHYESALASYERALSLGANKSEIYSNAGSLHEKLGRLDIARGLLTKATEEDPKNAAALYNFGVLLLREEDYDGALNYFEKTVGLNSRHANAFNNAGSLYDMQGRREKAFEYLTRAVELAPEHPFAYHNLGYHFMEQKMWAQAISNFQASLRNNPYYLPSYKELAKIYLMRNDEREFKRILERLLLIGEAELAGQLEQLRMLSYMSMATGKAAQSRERRKKSLSDQ